MLNFFGIMYIAFLVISSLIRVAYTRDKYKKKEKDPLLFLPFLGMFVLPFTFFFAPWLDFANYALPDIAGWVGVIAFAFASLLLWRSHVDLGKNWTPVATGRKKQTLVTNGVYSRIRHPMYAAHWIWGIAQLLLLGNWIAGPSMLVLMAPVYLIRVSKEEKLLIKTFGSKYTKYMKRIGRIFPKF